VTSSHIGTRRFQEEDNRTGKMSSRKMGISWDEVEEAAEDRRSWRNRVIQCIFDTG